jgi:hypothetical protein
MRITVPISDFQLDIGDVASSAARRVVTPPKKALFSQLVHLLSRAGTRVTSAIPSPRDEAIAAAALCVKWGSYYALLSDRHLPMWRPPVGCSRIADSEMARINIETSAALEELLTLRAADARTYADLIRAGAALLPIPSQRPVHPGASSLAAVVAHVHDALPSLPRRPDVDDRIERNPIRALANTLIYTCWRNGPIENIHAGRRTMPLPVRKRRLSAAEDRDLMTNLVSHLADAFESLGPILSQKHGHEVAARLCSWVPLMFPHDWTLTEACRVVELEGPEP